jgi:hypothetical protein
MESDVMLRRKKMPRLPKIVLLLTILILLSFVSPVVNAVSTVVGSGNDVSRYAFGLDPAAATSAFPDFAAGGTYQQVYASNAFSGPVTITQIAFAPNARLTSGAGTATYNFKIALSTTATGPGGLSTNLAANRGASPIQVFSGPFTATITDSDNFDVVIDITPFTYNPADGNLLLEVVFNSPTQFTGGSVLYFNAGFSPSTSRAANPSGSAGGAFTDGFGLQTRFTTKGSAQVTLGNLEQTFDGSPKSVAVTTDPPALGIVVTYDGSTTPPTSAGSYAVTAIVNDPNFIGQASGTLNIHKADQQITFDALPNKTLADANFNVSATASSNLAVSFAANGDCTLIGNQVHLTNTGACTITASQDGNANINAAPTVARTFAIGKADQQITFDALPDKKFGDADFNVSATASSNLVVSFSAGGDCTLNGTEVHLTGAGSCTITASQDGDSTHNAATAIARTFAIGKADQQITFDALPDKTFADPDFSVSATASSSLVVSFAASGSCTLSGSQVHPTGAGLCTITASQDGDANINAASPVARTFSISKSDQQITLDALADKTFADPDFNVSATASSNLAVSFSANGDCTLNGALVHLTGAGLCTITASQTGDDNYNAAASASRSFTISKATAGITLDNLAQSYDGTPKSATAATSPVGLGVTLTYSQNNVPVASPTNAGSYDVTATINDANYEGSASDTLVISKATPTINWNNPSDITYGTALSATQLNATASVAGAFVYAPPAGQVLHAGNNQTLHVDFTPTDAVNYNSVSKDVAVNVSQARLTVAAEDKTRVFGAANPQLTYTMTGFVNNDTQASATTGQPALTTTAVANSDAGLYPITASIGTLASNDYSFSFADGTLTVTKAGQAITFAPLANKTFGDAPFKVSASVGDSGNSVTFSSQTPASCSVTGDTVTILSAGACAIRASQTGSSNFNSAPDVDQSFNIAKAVTTTTLTSSVNPSALGQGVTLTATITSAAGVPSGTVQFVIDGTTRSPQKVLNPLGIITVSIDTLTAGSHTIVAEYSGAANFASSTGALAEDQAVNVASSISINDASLAEGDNGTKSFDFTVRLSQASNLVVKVDFATADGTAIAGTDYQSTGGTLTFAPGDLSQTITVPVNGNKANEANKTFLVNLTNPQNAGIVDGQGAGTILNDDAPGVGFSQNSYSFAEGAGHGDVIVTRTGDISRPMTIDYQTSDQSGVTPCQTLNTGISSDRCDYATATGSLRFEAGEQQKTIPLVIVNDAYVEGAEQLSIKLSNPQGAVLGSVETATITLTDDDAQLAAQNPIDDSDFFIRQQYIDFLGREPEEAGFQFWKARMTNTCPAGQQCDRIDTAIRFFGSDEFKERGYFVYVFYHASLGRRPTYAEWIMDVSKLNGAKTIAEQQAARDEFIREFINRQEFMNLYNGSQTGDAFVNALIQKSGVTPASKQQLIDNYAAAGRAQTLKAFIETAEVQAAFADRGFVTMLYFGLLRRDAEAGGFDFWIQKLNDTNHDYRFLIGGFLQSDEYRFRYALLSLAQ